MTDLKTGKHGGVRPNSGRKSQYDEVTTVIRVPVSKKELVKRFLKSDSAGLISFPAPLDDLSQTFAIKQVKALTYY